MDEFTERTFMKRFESLMLVSVMGLGACASAPKEHFPWARPSLAQKSESMVGTAWGELSAEDRANFVTHVMANETSRYNTMMWAPEHTEMSPEKAALYWTETERQSSQ